MMYSFIHNMTTGKHYQNIQFCLFYLLSVRAEILDFESKLICHNPCGWN